MGSTGPAEIRGYNATTAGIDVAKPLAHILSSTVMFGTGAGIACFFLRAHRTGDVTTYEWTFPPC